MKQTLSVTELERLRCVGTTCGLVLVLLAMSILMAPVSADSGMIWPGLSVSGGAR